DQNSDAVAVILPQRQKHVRQRRFADRDVFAVPRDADHFEIRAVRAAELQPLADRVLSGPVTPGHRLVDDDDARRVFLVALVEGAALHDLRPHRLEIFRRGGGVEDFDLFVLRTRDVPLDQHAPATGAVIERQRIGEARPLHAGQLPDALDDAFDKFAAPRFGVTLNAQVHRTDQNVFRVEARTDPLRVLQAANEQAGAD